MDNNPQVTQHGFTLIELMITVALAALVLALGVPAFDDMIRSNRTTAEFNRFLGDVAYARSEAIKRGSTISMCPTTDRETCSGTDWTTGWLVFVDDGGTTGTGEDRDINGDEELLRAAIAAKGEVDISTTNFIDGGGILFTGDGKLEYGNASDIGQLVVCDEAGAEYAKGLAFSPYGQFRQLRDTDDDNIVDYGAGSTNVTCS